MAIEIPKFIGKPEGINPGGQINSNTSTAKGLELVIMKVNAFIKSAQASCDAIIYGKFELQSNPNISGIKKAVDRGLLNVLEDIAELDFCNIANYLTKGNNTKKTFDPTNFPEGGTQQEKNLWKIQNEAFKLQSKIDKFYATWGSSQGQDSRLGLIELVREINIVTTGLLEVSSELNDPEIARTFPELSLASNFISNLNTKLNGYVSSGIIPENQIRSTIEYVDKLRIFLVSIQALSINKLGDISGQALTTAAGFIAGNSIQAQIQKLNRYIAPKKAPKFLKDLLKQVTKITSVGRKIISYVNLIKTFVKLCLLLIKVFYIIRRFLTALPVPNILTTAGVTTTIADLNESVIKEKGITRFIRRLQQINILLGNMVTFATGLIAAMDMVALRLRAIILNIESCNRELADEIQSAIEDIETTKNDLQVFVNEAKEAKNRVDNTFGEYTIEIVTEEVVDESINLRRRYGIARGKNNIIAVQSTPTFATLDLIIINEVKVLLISSGLVKSSLSSLSPEDTVTVMDAMNYLGSDQDIEFDVDSIGLDNLQDSEDQGLGLGNFVDNLPGGRAFRSRVRKNLIQSNQRLINTLKQTDPNSTYSQKIIQEKEKETKKLKIEELTSEREKLSKALIAAAINPLVAAAIVKKIKDIDEQLKQLKNG